MTNQNLDETKFQSIVDEIYEIGVARHKTAILEHATWNLADVKKSIKALPPLSADKAQSAIVISAGPSVHKRNSIKRIAEAKYKGTTIAVDGSYIACLKAGLIPDFVVTLDPGRTRMVRWFGDPDFEKNTANDDYFTRQDLDIEFRKNSIEQNKEHIKLVNKMGHLTKAIVASTAPLNVAARIKEAKFDAYWWNPLVDDPKASESLTRQLYNINKLPCFNTGGTVGSASWVFANSILKIPVVAVVGMDFGYYKATPIQQTQTYYELLNHLGSDGDIGECFVDFEFPLTKEIYYTDPTYFWYRRNFLQILEKSNGRTFNCTEGGTLFGNDIECIYLDQFLEKSINNVLIKGGLNG